MRAQLTFVDGDAFVGILLHGVGFRLCSTCVNLVLRARSAGSEGIHVFADTFGSMLEAERAWGVLGRSGGPADRRELAGRPALGQAGQPAGP